MPAVLERIHYPIPDDSNFNADIPVGGYPVKRAGALEFRRLSPFNVPEAVEVEARHHIDEIRIRLQYPNDEPGERSERNIPGIRSRSVLLGKHTRKILRLTIGSGACQMLASGEDLLPRDAAAYWVDGLADSAMFACVRNCEVVSEILGHIPTDIRTQIINVIKYNRPDQPL